jgi:hypothetical protein
MVMVTETYEKMSQMLNTTFSKTLGYNNIVSGIVYFLILLYISMLSPEVPPVVQTLFKNAFFKVFVFTIIMWSAKIDPLTAILLSVAFLVTMNYVNNKPLWEFVDNVVVDNAITESNVVAPTKEIAVDGAVAVLRSQVENPQTISSITETAATTIVTPLVKDGNVSIPSVVIVPTMVKSDNGQEMIVTPNVTLVEPKKEEAKKEDKKEDKEETVGCYQYKMYDITKVKPMSADANFSML